KNGVSVDGKIKRKTQYFMSKWILGLQHVWDVGEKGSVGLAVGVEFLDEWIHGHNNDILIRYNSSHWGPAVRVSAHW
ncbi:MAG: hypothetical protein FWG49_03285, partial [Leptospirales bacterium]|nr:hypothetical protein [Leptospirales bacterium]